jgi:hypothetical protein
MSGGSYGYLCYVEDATDLTEKRGELEKMRERLSGLPWAHAAAVETERIAAAVRRLDAYLEASRSLMDVWRAVEWWDSGDTGEDAVRLAAREYESLIDLPSIAEDARSPRGSLPAGSSTGAVSG